MRSSNVPHFWQWSFFFSEQQLQDATQTGHMSLSHFDEYLCLPSENEITNIIPFWA
jgi:hypothetical protein